MVMKFIGNFSFVVKCVKVSAIVMMMISRIVIVPIMASYIAPIAIVIHLFLHCFSYYPAECNKKI